MPQTTSAPTISAAMPWLKTLLDYTDAVCGCLPGDAATLRPVQPGGAFVFSALELVMHIADERWSLHQNITGADHAARLFGPKYPGKDAPWEFRAATPAEAIASLREARAALDALIEQPAAELLASTPQLVTDFEARVAKRREAGEDTAALEAKGPSTLANILVFLVAHETGHRAVLQHMLRMHGVDVVRYA